MPVGSSVFYDISEIIDMSWLKNSNFGSNLGKIKSSSPPKECDPSAIYESFKKHWQQTNEIIEKTEVSTDELVHS